VASSGVQRIVAVGSLEELGQRGGVLDPSAPAAPTTTYGLAKSLVRQVADFEARRHPLRVDWFRPTIVYGPGQDEEMLLPSAFRAALAGGGGAFSSGEQRRNFLYVDDLADWVWAMLDVPCTALGFHLHHVGGADTVPVRDVLTLVATEFGVELGLGAIPRRKGEPDLQTVAPFRSDERPLGDWRPRVELREGVRRTADWWRSRR
jgi:nucleoside-diphosphate-sugar epimerase